MVCYAKLNEDTNVYKVLWGIQLGVWKEANFMKKLTMHGVYFMV